jgi:hypothetical protein
MGLVKQKVIQLTERGNPKVERDCGELLATIEEAVARLHGILFTAQMLPKCW